MEEGGLLKCKYQIGQHNQAAPVCMNFLKNCIKLLGIPSELSSKAQDKGDLLTMTSLDSRSHLLSLMYAWLLMSLMATLAEGSLMKRKA